MFMKTIKFFLTTISVLLCSVMANAHDFTIGGVFYNITSYADLTVEVTYQGSSSTYAKEYNGTVTIPSTVTYDGKTYKVTSIGEAAFGGCDGLDSVMIPEGVTSIGNYAFSQCTNLIFVTIPDGVTSIGKQAFISCYNLTSFVIPESVMSIGEDAFTECGNLTSIIVAQGNTTYDSRNNCNALIESKSNTLIKGCSATIIPETVTSIHDRAFHHCKLTHITIPSSIIIIGKEAFQHCDSLSSVTFSDGSQLKTIPERCFANCSSLSSIAIPNSITSIESYSFIGCYNLTYLTISSNLISIGAGSFFGCKKLSQITIPESLVSIGDDAFYYCSNLYTVINYSNLTFSKESSDYGGVAYYAKKVLNRPITVGDFQFCSSGEEYYLANYIGNDYGIVLPNSYNGKNYKIGDYAFYNYEIKSLCIGSGVISIGKESFTCVPTKVIWLTNTPPTNYAIVKGNIHYVSNDQYTNLDNVIIYPYLSSLFTVDGVKYVPISPSDRTCNVIDCEYDSTSLFINIGETISFQGIAMRVMEIMPYTCSGNNQICKVFISHSGSIGEQAFSNCDNLVTIEVSNKGDIGAQVFYDCNNIKTINISNQGHIKEKAFYNCNNIENIKIANNGDIAQLTFYNCRNIKTLSISNDGKIHQEAFHNCDTLEFAHINNTGDIENYAFHKLGCVKKMIVSNQGNVKDMAFRNCGKVDTLIITSDGNIGNEAFYASGIQYLYVNNIGSIGDEAFEGCTILNSVILGDSVKSLGIDAFRGCYELKEIIIPSSIEVIGKSCFYDCVSLESAVLGDRVRELNDSTFYQCKKLQEIVIPSSVETIGAYCFYDCSNLKRAIINNNLKIIKSSAFRRCASLSEINLPKSITSIASYVFKDCSQLSNVIIEDRTTVLKLGSNNSSPLFADCPLDSVYIGGQIVYNTSQNYGYSPFYRNNSLRTIVITNQEEQIYENEFYGCSNLKNVMIGDGVKSIGNYAFSGCSSLKSFSFGNKMESIGIEAFSDCATLVSITSNAIVPPICGANALDDINKWSCVLKVPQNYKIAYQAADQWKEFFFIEDVVEVKKYAVTYMVDNEIFATDSLAVGESIVPIAEPTKKGYTFSGWSNIPETMPAENVTVTGTFTPNTYIITYIVDEEIFAMDTVTYGDSISPIAEPTKEGYTFSGWSEVPEIMPAEDLVVTGSFVRNTYTITYVVDSVVYATDSITYGDTIALLDEPTQEGYTFSGWSDAPVTMPAEDIIIEGTFNVNYYALKYIVDNEPFATDSLAYGDTIRLREEPQKVDFEFSGWSEVPETMPAHDVEVYGNFIFTSITDVKVDSEQSQKVVEDNQLFIILPNGKKFNIMGQEVRN